MTDITITTVSSLNKQHNVNIINDKTPFIIIHYDIDDKNKNLFTKKYEDDAVTIYGINKSQIKTILNEKHIKNIFTPIADVMFSNSKSIDKINNFKGILLVNKLLNISKEPTSYEKVMRLGDGYIWKPSSISSIVCTNTTNIDNFKSPLTTYDSMGLIYSIDKPSGYRIIDTNYLKISDIVIGNFAIEHLILCNEYGMFVIEYDEQKTIDIQKILYVSIPEDKPPHIINDCPSLASQTKTEHPQFIRRTIPEDAMFSQITGNVVRLEQSEHSDVETFEQIPTDPTDKATSDYTNKDVRYLQDGRVEIGNKCLDVNNTGTISLSDCVDTLEQQWIFNNGNLVNRKTGKCLDDINNNHAYLTECKEEGTFVDPSEPDTKFPRWNKKFGKNVVLTSAEDPWYINTETTTPVIVEHEKTQSDPHNTTFSKPYGMFSAKNLKTISVTQPDIGVEGFCNNDNSKNKLLTLFSCLLILIIIIQLIYILKY